MKVEVVTRHKGRSVDIDRVKDVVKKCSVSILPAGSVISVAFLDDYEMTEINEAYTGRSGTTDVLSFPLGKSYHDRHWYGEILISLDKAYRQAKCKGISPINEVMRLLIHAIVHLGGLDHHDKKSFREMRRVEFKLLLKALKMQ